jgi:hypothetical protein
MSPARQRRFARSCSTASAPPRRKAQKRFMRPPRTYCQPAEPKLKSWALLLAAEQVGRRSAGARSSWNSALSLHSGTRNWMAGKRTLDSVAPRASAAVQRSCIGRAWFCEDSRNRGKPHEFGTSSKTGVGGRGGLSVAAPCYAQPCRTASRADHGRRLSGGRRAGCGGAGGRELRGAGDRRRRGQRAHHPPGPAAAGAGA